MDKAETGLRDCWYAAVFSYLVGNKPYSIKVLGVPLVFYRNSLGSVECVLDKCPHRSAQLSLGRIVGGHLECKYHGWQFGEDGKCVLIPSAPTIQKLSAYCATPYPVVERWGMLWVFIGDRNLAEQSSLPGHLFVEYEDKQNWVANTGFRDLNIDHGLMVENLLDPAHLPFTHEGTLAKRSDATDLAFDVIADTLTGQSNVKQEVAPFVVPDNERFAYIQGLLNSIGHPDKAGQYFTFHAPYIVRLDTESNGKLILLFFCVPVTPTKMRLNYIFVRNFGLKLNKLSFFQHLFIWQTEKVIEQDVELLGGQQTNLQLGAKYWNSSVPADKLGVRYRQWRKVAEQKNPWFIGFELTETVDIEDLVGSPITSNTKNKQTKQQTIVGESGGKDFCVKERTPLFSWTFRVSFVVCVCTLAALVLVR